MSGERFFEVIKVMTDLFQFIACFIIFYYAEHLLNEVMEKEPRQKLLVIRGNI